jgi:uncharacterized membrane protein YraQ (UPF0718 family)
MLDQVISILNYIVDSFLHIWPYLLVTIPIAVAVQMSGASKYISKAFKAQPLVAILLATLLGAFSPFCSCGVIPVIASLLIGGVPLAPVMSFWLASPSMDPEIFFLSAGMLGWELAVWRLLSTLVMSLSGGFLTHFLIQRGWLGVQFIRSNQSTQTKSVVELAKSTWLWFNNLSMEIIDSLLQKKEQTLFVEATCCPEAISMAPNNIVRIQPISNAPLSNSLNWSSATAAESINTDQTVPSTCGNTQTNMGGIGCDTSNKIDRSFWQRLIGETWKATTMVGKFMALAFFLTALIKFYVPSTWINEVLGNGNPYAILSAALIGIPVYSSNLTALPMVSGLMEEGMNPGVALAFLIAGPTTTLPAMAAVWGLVSRRVFILYLSISLVVAVVFGYLFSWLA